MTYLPPPNINNIAEKKIFLICAVFTLSGSEYKLLTQLGHPLTQLGHFVIIGTIFDKDPCF